MLFTQTVSAPPSHAVTEVSGARYHFLFFLSSQFALKQSKAGILWLTHLGVQGPTGRRAGALPSSSLAGARGGGGAKSPRPATRPSSLTRRADGADTGPDLPKRSGPSRPPPPGADRTVPAGRGSPGHVAGRAQQSGTHGAGRALGPREICRENESNSRGTALRGKLKGGILLNILSIWKESRHVLG